MQKTAADFEDYAGQFPATVQNVLCEMHETIESAMPEAEKPSKVRCSSRWIVLRHGASSSAWCN